MIIITINVENSCDGSYFCGDIFFWILWIEGSKELNLFKMEIICNITFDQSNASLLNKTINFLKNKSG